MEYVLIIGIVGSSLVVLGCSKDRCMNFDFYSFMFGVVAIIAVLAILASIIDGISWLSNSPRVKDYKPSYPLRWWVDDLSHRTCGLLDHPIYGIADMPWPDNEKVYIAIDESYHHQALGWFYAEACSLLDQGKDIRKENFPTMLERMEKDLSNEN